MKLSEILPLVNQKNRKCLTKAAENKGFSTKSSTRSRKVKLTVFGGSKGLDTIMMRLCNYSRKQGWTEVKKPQATIAGDNLSRQQVNRLVHRAHIMGLLIVSSGQLKHESNTYTITPKARKLYIASFKPKEKKCYTYNNSLKGIKKNNDNQSNDWIKNFAILEKENLRINLQYGISNSAIKKVMINFNALRKKVTNHKEAEQYFTEYLENALKWGVVRSIDSFKQERIQKRREKRMKVVMHELPNYYERITSEFKKIAFERASEVVGEENVYNAARLFVKYKSRPEQMEKLHWITDLDQEFLQYCFFLKAKGWPEKKVELKVAAPSIAPLPPLPSITERIHDIAPKVFDAIDKEFPGVRGESVSVLFKFQEGINTYHVTILSKEYMNITYALTFKYESTVEELIERISCKVKSVLKEIKEQ